MEEEHIFYFIEKKPMSDSRWDRPYVTLWILISLILKKF